MTDDLRSILLDAMRSQITDPGDRFAHTADIGFAPQAELECMVDNNMFGVVEVMREDLRRYYCDFRDKCAVDIYTPILLKLPRWAPWAVMKKWIEKRMIERNVREVMVSNPRPRTAATS